MGVGLGVALFSPTNADFLSEAVPSPQQSVQQQPPEAVAKAPEAPEKTEVKAELTSGTEPSPEESEEEEESNDPLEPLNRFFYGINLMLDVAFLKPLAEVYRAVAPEPVRNGVRNVLDNLFAPVVFLNHILQGEAERATVTLGRFLMNSTIGCLGLVDAATEFGHPGYDTDLNQTLAVWGVETGPYLVLPLIGSSSFRG